MSRFLPPAMKSHLCCIDSYDLRLSNESDGRQLYTYTVTWHDLQQFKQSNSTDDVRLTTVSPQFSFMSVSPKQDMSLADMNICKRIQPSNAPSSQIRECHCDGPCGKMKPVGEMHIMGLCDHYICRDCLEKAPAVETAGGFGCPNASCYQTDLMYTNGHRRPHKIQEIISMPSHRTATTDKSDQSIVPTVLKSRPCLRLVEVRLTAFIPLRNSEKVFRQQQIIEIYGDYTMLQTLNILKEYERLSSLDIANHVYYCPSGLIDERSFWKHIREDDLLMPITNFGQEDQRIDIIFDYTVR
ncbi:hypothetical protein WUBG_03231 [Wuchereria bancrofti]|uniref:RING-type domain-containing protein n=1 Tax=Wuchereria bancrofti TaxID=6293 RepID=J9ETF2_WUCBA|nr:hypothetical protein WUBG_03231 [Wuchereria bancrofti]